jgi:hypothetical protein
MNNDYWNTGWDPHQALLQCEQNILQCAGAINHSTEVMKDLANKYNHQQEVIQQLMFNNRKLSGQLNMQSSTITRLQTDIELLKQQLQN